MPHDHTATENLEPCIAAVQRALTACLHCAAQDLRDGHADSMAQCALINLDCADICQATLGALARRSKHHGDFCAICAHLCRACATECALHDTEHCRACMAACEQCARACAEHAGERHKL